MYTQVFPQAAQAQYESKIFGVVSYGVIPKMAVNIKDLYGNSSKNVILCPGSDYGSRVD